MTEHPKPERDQAVSGFEVDASSDASSHAGPSAEKPVPVAIPESRMRWGLVGFLLLLILIMIVALQNSQTTKLSFLAWETPEMPLSVVILGTAVVAVLIDELFGIVWRFRRRRRRKAIEKALQ